MIHRLELLNALEGAPSRPLATTAWRHMFGTHPPETENTRGARWNPPDLAAIYLCCTRDGAIAEGDHAISVQPLRPRTRRFVYPIAITLDNVLDLSDSAVLATTGISDKQLTDDDHTACREVAAAVAWLEHDGLLVPSVRSDATNLVIYPALCSPTAQFDSGPGEALK